MSSSASLRRPEPVTHEADEVNSKLSIQDVKTLATGLDHPEGVALGPDGMLYAGGEAGQVLSRLSTVDPGVSGAPLLYP